MKTIFKVVAGESPPPSNYIRGLDNGSFTCLSSLCRHLIRAGKRREVLTALSIFRRLKVEPVFTDKLISSVVTPFTGEKAKFDFRLFGIIARQVIPVPSRKEEWMTLTDNKFVAKRLWCGYNIKSSPILWSSKNGPNGQSLHTIEQDLNALQADKKVFDSVSKAWKYFGLNFDRMVSEVKPKKTKSYHSKLAAIQAPACKTRIVALGDYFTQVPLAFVHQKCMNVLRSLKSDGTKSHRQCATRLGIGSENRRFVSIDISSATDRFPLFLQVPIIEIMFPGLGEIWGALVSSRQFFTPKGFVQYAVGQPMGFLSSWPAFALSNHILARMACYNAGFRGKDGFAKPMYRLVGDDIVFVRTEAAQEYRKLLSILGVGYTMPEFKDKGSFEFCKRYYYRGQDVSPVTADLGVADIRVIPGLAALEGIKIPPTKLGKLFWKQRNWKIFAFNPTSSLGNHWGYTQDEFSLVYQEISAASLQSWVREGLNGAVPKVPLDLKGTWLSKRVLPLVDYWRKQATYAMCYTPKEFLVSEEYKFFKCRYTPQGRFLYRSSSVSKVPGNFQFRKIGETWARLTNRKKGP